jgi:hypothetical protein
MGINKKTQKVFFKYSQKSIKINVLMQIKNESCNQCLHYYFMFSTCGSEWVFLCSNKPKIIKNVFYGFAHFQQTIAIFYIITIEIIFKILDSFFFLVQVDFHSRLFAKKKTSPF